MFLKKYLKTFIQGIVVGFALISGMGGGTVAILMGIYDDLIIAIADFTKHPKASLQLLIPLLIGAFVGIGALIVPINLALRYFPFPATSLFVGLTIGGFRSLKKEVQGHANTLNIVFAIIGIVFAASFGVFSFFATGGVDLSLMSPLQFLLLFVVGFAASAALVAPGISGTLFLISIGYMEEITRVIKEILSFQNWGNNLLVAASLGLGIAVGFVVISKIMRFFLAKYKMPTYFVILGFIVGSIFACYFNGDIKSAYPADFELGTLIASIVTLAIGIITSYYLLQLVEKKENKSVEA